MIIQLSNALYLIVAVAMVILILMQRGAGAAAGSGFGAGASATVFGARGASNFLSTSTKWLAILFFALSLGMAMYASRSSRGPAEQDLGVMGAVSAPAEQIAPASEVPSLPAAESQSVPVDDEAPATEIDTESDSNDD